MSNNIANVFTRKYNELMSIGSLDELKQNVYQIIKALDDKSMYTRKITLNVININSLTGLQTYITNTMLRSQGHGLSSR